MDALLLAALLTAKVPMFPAPAPGEEKWRISFSGWSQEWQAHRMWMVPHPWGRRLNPYENLPGGYFQLQGDDSGFTLHLSLVPLATGQLPIVEYDFDECVMENANNLWNSQGFPVWFTGPPGKYYNRQPAQVEVVLMRRIARYHSGCDTQYEAPLPQVMPQVGELFSVEYTIP